MAESEMPNFSAFCREMLLTGKVKHYDFYEETIALLVYSLYIVIQLKPYSIYILIIKFITFYKSFEIVEDYNTSFLLIFCLAYFSRISLSFIINSVSSSLSLSDIGKSSLFSNIGVL